MKTLMPKQLGNDARKWYVVDAEGQTLGRLSTQIATILKGKNKVSYAPHVDNGDYVIVLNSDKFVVTGKKLEDKIYYRHTGFMGGIKQISLGKLLNKKPTEALSKAVSGMLPKNKLRSDMLSRLKLVVGNEHGFKAQKPETLTLS
ncbi:MAG: 50S ribosomal protein L13 [Candidatus Altimarinota bacterium]